MRSAERLKPVAACVALPLVDHGITLPAASYVNEVPGTPPAALRREEAALRREARIERTRDVEHVLGAPVRAAPVEIWSTAERSRSADITEPCLV